jgi:hypothetical protein
MWLLCMLFAFPTKCDHNFFSCSFLQRLLNLNISYPIITQLFDSEVFLILLRRSHISVSLSETCMDLTFLVCISHVHLNDICVPNVIKTTTGVSKLRTYNFCPLIFYLRCRDNSVCIAMGYSLKGRGSIPGRSKFFSSS